MPSTYWTKVGAFTFEDPDNWRIVLVPTPGKLDR
ncbi:hypothetical protein [Nocardia sp. NPDC127526]